MTWFVILSGSYWREVSPEIFKKHSMRDDWSQLSCDTLDSSEAMIEVEHDGLKILIPRNAVIAAVNLQNKKHAKGFALSNDEGDEHNG
jgi:hypothetical protein